MTDPIADMLTRLRNASQARHDKVEMPGSRERLAIAQVLRDQGFVRDVEWLPAEPQAKLRLTMKYGPDREPVVHGLRRVSRPGRRVYVPADAIPRVMGGLGVAVVSTPQGIMSGQDARRQNVGGEVLCIVW